MASTIEFSDKFGTQATRRLAQTNTLEEKTRLKNDISELA